MVYPTYVGDFARVSLVRYQPDESAVGVGYNRTRPVGEEIAATVFVHPSPRLMGALGSRSANAQARRTLCESEFRANMAEILRHYPGAEMIEAGEFRLSQANAEYQGLRAVFNYSSGRNNFFGSFDASLRSELYIFCYMDGRWTVKHRITHRARHDAASEIAAFLRDLTLTIGPQEALATGGGPLR
ncbi:MAG: hypothetical protein KIS81_01355 [Maricaulaceae bacterium]|nr:hypothetical protein [Maricaulaceae bacterium]